jgi:hypothetical protein
MPLGERCLWPGAHCSAAAQPLSALRSPGSGRVVGKSKSHTHHRPTPHTTQPACLPVLGAWAVATTFSETTPYAKVTSPHPSRSNRTGWCHGIWLACPSATRKLFLLLRILFLCGQAITFSWIGEKHKWLYVTTYVYDDAKKFNKTTYDGGDDSDAHHI